MRDGIVAAVLALGCGAAVAQEVTLGRAGDPTVFVWRNGDAMDEGYALIRAGVHKTRPEMILRLLSCIAEPGDKAVIVDAGMLTHTILIVDGPQAGCRGDVSFEEVKR